MTGYVCVCFALVKLDNIYVLCFLPLKWEGGFKLLNKNNESQR